MKTLTPWLRLQLTPGLGRLGLFHLIDHYHSPEAALLAREQGWPRQPGMRHGLERLVPEPDDPRVEEAQTLFQDAGGWFLHFWEEGYPEQLRQISDPPAMIYGRGLWQEAESLAIVGARKPSRTGQRVAEELAEKVAENGIVIVSGLARGIDTAAHRGALSAKGTTVAVLGCGIDRIYPASNTTLVEQILGRGGALLSEYPPGTEPLPGHFPGRNRIISGLSRGTLVVEATEDSGSLITADFALDQGREVMAVPGSVDRATSKGTNRLIKQGAHPVTEVDDIMQLLWPGQPLSAPRSRREHRPVVVSETALQLLKTVDETPRHIDELAGESGLTPMELSAILLQLELQGGVEQLPGARYIRGRTADSYVSRTEESS